MENKGHFNYRSSAGLAYEAEEVRKCIEAGKIQSDIMPHSDTIKLAGMMDQLRAAVGVVYPADEEVY